MATYDQVLAILKSWSGTGREKWQQWDSTYDSCQPPPPGPAWTDEFLADWISRNYTGPDPEPPGQ